MTNSRVYPEKIWIGPNYPGFGVFILGESWYGEYPDDLVTDDGYVRAYLAGRKSDGMYTRMANACGMTKEAFWNSIVFTNFAQRVGPSRTDRPTDRQYREAIPRLQRILSEQKPRGVWVLGLEQGKISAPVIQSAGIPCEVAAHPTSYGLTNRKLGESWRRLLAKLDCQGAAAENRDHAAQPRSPPDAPQAVRR
jgi:hypothetical protein